MRADLTLLTALGLPWRADGLQRDGPHVRELVDAIRYARRWRVLRWAVPWYSARAKCAGTNALAAMAPRVPEDLLAGRSGCWHWVCRRCGDAGLRASSLPSL